ncbi:MAG TPA: hypothetical protein VMA96_03870 [Solirubrobacteraceae bacterium]|nr:hypothetical protein [Solirubrobacteraceae bacterium]
MIRRCWLPIVLAAILLAVTAGAVAAFPRSHQASVSVGGAVATPATYSLAQLGALPQTSFSVSRRWWLGSRTETDQGVSVEDLVNTAAPTLPSAKNALLRVTVAVSGRWGRSVTFALGELDSGFGNHPAYLALDQNGHALPAPELVVPGDVNNARTVSDVDQITVAVQNPTPTTPPAGSVTIEDGSITRTLSTNQLAALPSRTLNVSFLAGTASQSHTEVGPTLADVLRAARIWWGPNTWVAAVGSDGYVATVTPAEAFVGGRPLQISLNEDGQAPAQPRLVVDGDVKGGRYVSGVVDLVVGQGVPPHPGW